MRLLLALAALIGYDIWSSDITKTYLQASEPLGRDIYLKNPGPEFALKPEECLQLLRPLYGLCDAGDLWQSTLDHHHREDLGMTSSNLDAKFYYLLENKVLVGLSGTDVDDLFRAGNQQFRQHTTKTTDKFDMTNFFFHRLSNTQVSHSLVTARMM